MKELWIDRKETLLEIGLVWGVLRSNEFRFRPAIKQDISNLLFLVEDILEKKDSDVLIHVE